MGILLEKTPETLWRPKRLSKFIMPWSLFSFFPSFYKTRDSSLLIVTLSSPLGGPKSHTRSWLFAFFSHVSSNCNTFWYLCCPFLLCGPHMEDRWGFCYITHMPTFFHNRSNTEWKTQRNLACIWIFAMLFDMLYMFFPSWMCLRVMLILPPHLLF